MFYLRHRETHSNARGAHGDNPERGCNSYARSAPAHTQTPRSPGERRRAPSPVQGRRGACSPGALLTASPSVCSWVSETPRARRSLPPVCRRLCPRWWAPRARAVPRALGARPTLRPGEAHPPRGAPPQEGAGRGLRTRFLPWQHPCSCTALREGQAQAPPDTCSCYRLCNQSILTWHITTNNRFRLRLKKN